MQTRCTFDSTPMVRSRTWKPKHSQMCYLIGIADKDDKFNITHSQSSRAPRRSHSTEESELMALDIALRCLEKYGRIIFQLLKREVPVIVYIDCETLWKNLMQETPISIPEIRFRVREKINLGIVTSVCFLPDEINPADVLTKQKPNKKISKVLETNLCISPCRQVYMLQTSPYRNASWIPTMKVPMPSKPP